MNIPTTQEDKYEAIKLSAAQRDAVLIVSTFKKPTAGLVNGTTIGRDTLEDEEIKSEIEKWYKYFLNFGEQPLI